MYMDQEDYNGRTALHAAVRNKNSQMVAELLQYDTIPMTKDKWRQAALDEATMNNLPSILTLFNIEHPERLVALPCRTGCDKTVTHSDTPAPI
ncbi:hypothetical protein MHYP_G00109360 [Metynnis hypsauchen]